MKTTLVYPAAVILCIAAFDPQQVTAQGCVLLRQTSPMFGTAGPPDEEVGTWNVTFTARSSTADTHYSGTVRQIQREQQGTFVVNRQHSMTMTIGYQMSPRVSLNVGVPFVEASWGIPSPRTGGEAARANENARGASPPVRGEGMPHDASTNGTPTLRLTRGLI